MFSVKVFLWVFNGGFQFISTIILYNINCMHPYCNFVQFCSFFKCMFVISNYIKCFGVRVCVVYVVQQNVQVSSTYIYQIPYFTHELKNQKPLENLKGIHGELVFWVLKSWLPHMALREGCRFDSQGMHELIKCCWSHLRKCILHTPWYRMMTIFKTGIAILINLTKS